MPNILPIRSLEDIQANTVTVDEFSHILYMGPDSDSVKALGKITPPDWPQDRSCPMAVDRHDPEWYGGTTSFDHAVEMLHTGWPEGTKQAAELARNIRIGLPKATKPVMHYRPSVAPIGGLRLNIYDIAKGGPQPFIGRFKGEQEKVGRKIVKIVADNWFSASVSREVMRSRGAAMLAVVQMLETMRIACDVTIAYDTVSGGRKSLQLWNVKPAGYALNTDRLAFALGNEGSLRRIAFRMLEYTPMPAGKTFWNNYGNGLDSKGIAVDWPDVAKTYDVVMGMNCGWTVEGGLKMTGEWSDPQSQIAWVKSTLASQGIHFEG